MWVNKRQRYVFRKRSKWGRILWLLIGTLILVGSVWFIPWQTLSPVDVEDTLKSEAPVKAQPEQASVEDQPGQAPAEDQPEQADTQEQPEQGGTSGQPRNEAALERTPPKEEGAPNNSPSPSLPTAAQLSPPPQAPSTARVKEVPQDSLAPNDYWYAEPNYWYVEPAYWYSGADYWDSGLDYGSDYYYYYYWDY